MTESTQNAGQRPRYPARGQPDAAARDGLAMLIHHGLRKAPAADVGQAL